MIKSEKGITIVSLIITVIVIVIIAGTTIHTSMDRFEVNNLNKMYNDIELLSDKIDNYYLKYSGLPIVRDSSNNKIVYASTLDFDHSSSDSGDYYIIDVKAMEGISLNYGEEGINAPSPSVKDIYIVNEGSHIVYYVKGIEMDGDIYHALPEDENTIIDNIPPTKPEIKIISGTKDDEGKYITQVKIEIVPGKDNLSGIERTTYCINDGEEKNINTLENNICKLFDNGTYIIKGRSYDKAGNMSENNSEIELKSDYIRCEYIESTGTQWIDTGVFHTLADDIEIKFLQKGRK